MNIIDRSITTERALRTFGVKAQRTKTIEELSELITALAKYENNLNNEDSVIDEIADVLIMLEQMMSVFGVERVRNQVRLKLERLKNTLDRMELDRER